MLRPGAFRAALMDGINPLVQRDFIITPELPNWLTFSRASNAMMFDRTGALTYAPNNLQTFSNTFDNAIWTASRASVVPGQVDPLGGTTAHKLIEDSTAANSHRIFSSYAVTQNVKIFSVYAKAGGRNFMFLRINNVAGSGVGAFFNLTNGATSALGAGIGAGTESIGGGWYRCWIYIETSASPVPYIAPAQVSGSEIYDGDGTSGIFIWRAQVEAATYQTAPRAYNATTSAAYFGPRFDNAPAVANSPLGLLIEEARTNSIRNSTMQGASAGSPGTLPTNCSVSAIGTLTQTLAVGTEYGMPYLDLRLNGITSNTSLVLNLESVTQVAATTGQTWTGSFFVRMVAGSTTNVISLIQINERNNLGSNLAFSQSAFTPTLTLQRVVISRVFNQATTAFTNHQLAFTWSNGVAIDITLRIYQPQLEQGAFVTSAIPTYGVALTRAADITYGTFPQLNVNSGALIVEATPMAIITAGMLAEGAAGVGGAVTGMSLSQDSAFGRWRAISRVGANRFDNTSSGPSVTSGSPSRAGASWGARPNGAANGALLSNVTPPSQADWASPPVIYLGMRGQGAGSLWGNIWLRSIALYPAALNDSALRSRSVVGAPY
jgi:hypothetical protein